MQQPLVSIVIPTHRPNHLRIALMCALGQTYANTEIIVSDNSGGEEIKEFCDRFPNVIYRRNTDGKPASNIAEGLRQTKGEFIKYLFDDDIIYPHCIDSMIGWLGQFTPDTAAGVGLITSARHLINDNSLAYQEIKEPSAPVTSLVAGEGVIQRILTTQDNFIGEFSTVLFRRSLMDLDNNPKSIFSAYGDDFSIGLVDVPLYLALLQKSNMVYIPHSLSAFRKHSGGGSNVAANPGFHTVVSDWFRLILGATREGVLTPQAAIAGTQSYLTLAAHFENVFSEQLAPWNQKAREFIAEQAARVQA